MPRPPNWRTAFNDPQQPVVSVSWLDAKAYCNWISQALGKTFRLPTEAEWERAARGGVEDSLYPWGDCQPQELPKYAERWKTGPEPVGLFSPNAYGLYNLGDNVHEWCSDWYDAGYYAISPVRSPQGPATGIRRASRGGSWRHHIKVTRTAARSSIPPEFQYADYGFLYRLEELILPYSFCPERCVRLLARWICSAGFESSFLWEYSFYCIDQTNCEP